MLKVILFLVIVLPILEISLLILSGKILGIGWTFLLIVATTILGAWFAKREGLQTFRLAQLQLQQGQIPNGIILDGLCILAGAIVLLIPGFITDIIGFLLLLPNTRAIAKAFLQQQLKRMLANGSVIFINRR